MCLNCVHVIAESYLNVSRRKYRNEGVADFDNLDIFLELAGKPEAPLNSFKLYAYWLPSLKPTPLVY